MATMKMARPMFEIAHMSRPGAMTCSFSTASRLMKKTRTAGMAPKVRRATRTGTSSSSSTKQNSSDYDNNYKPASGKVEANKNLTAALQSAFNSGQVTIDVKRQIEYLHRYQEREKEYSSLEKKAMLSKEFQLTPLDLYKLSKVLGSMIDQRATARKLMVDAAELGEPSAACELVESGIRGNAFANPEFSEHLQRLKRMADSTGPSGLRAKMTLGSYFISQQKYKEAMGMLKVATDGEKDSPAAAQAFFNMGKIFLQWKDRDAAHSAFIKSAQGAHREALYYIAAATKDGSQYQKEAYQIAALSGIHEASHNLGDIELEIVRSRPDQPKTLLDYGMAREWFQVAATNDYIPSMLNMALICKSVDEMETGMQWLENAEKWQEKKPSPEMRDLAKQIRKNWGNRNIDLTAADSGYCRKIDPFKDVRGI